MYAVANITKFVHDHRKDLKRRGRKILHRAGRMALRGGKVIHGVCITYIFGDDRLAGQFQREATSREHQQLTDEAMKDSGLLPDDDAETHSLEDHP